MILSQNLYRTLPVVWLRTDSVYKVMGSKVKVSGGGMNNDGWFAFRFCLVLSSKNAVDEYS